MPIGKKLSTKKRILLTAIKLYNERGVQTVTSRHIAAEMGIAYGNLDYHYKNKETILLAIYKEMRAEMSGSYIFQEDNNTSFEHFHQLLLHLEKFQHKYRFFNLDVLEITRSYPKISKIIKKTLALRKQQMTSLFDEFVSDGFLVQPLNGTYSKLQHTIRIVITFWLSQQDILENYKSPMSIDMSKHIWELLKPFMTPLGHEEYTKLKDISISK